jgi:hypothetical protein
MSPLRWVGKWKKRMNPTRRRSPKLAPRRPPDDGLDEMRLTFHAKLQDERMHLATLSAALARADESAAWIFHDLQFRSHKIRGGAAIFEMAEVAAAACVLEEAAHAACMTKADNTDAGVWAALVAIVRLLGTFDGTLDIARRGTGPGSSHIHSGSE